MPGFRFDKTRTFKENIDYFLTEVEQEDTEMAVILRNNFDKVSEMVREGSRNAQARASFNSSVIEALEKLLDQELSAGE